MYTPFCSPSLIITFICDDSDEIQRCVIVSYSPMIYPHSDYDKLRNWQIPDKITSDSEVAFNSSNGSITIESMNEARILENGWERHVISPN